MDFYLYDEYKEMTLYDFSEVCKLPFEGSVEEPHPRDVEDFIDEVTIGERRRVWKRECVVCIFLFCAITHYLLGDV